MVVNRELNPQAKLQEVFNMKYNKIQNYANNRQNFSNRCIYFQESSLYTPNSAHIKDFLSDASISTIIEMGIWLTT